MSSSNLIISADDFGISEKANKNILLLAQQGKLQRVAIMPMGHISREEARELEKTGVQLDIHLDIFRAQHNPDGKMHGTIRRSIHFIWEYLSGRLRAKKIQIEWENQIIKFQEIFERFPDGINSHEHVHFFPPYFKIVSILAEKYAIKFIRFGKIQKTKNLKLVSHILAVLRNLNQWKFKNGRHSSSKYLVSLDWIEDLEKYLKNLPMGDVEIVTHPERDNEFEIITKHF